ncbi:MAG: hypothetical protein ACT4P2_09255 [Pseudomonadota bacterium]
MDEFDEWIHRPPPKPPHVQVSLDSWRSVSARDRGKQFLDFARDAVFVEQTIDLELRPEVQELATSQFPATINQLTVDMDGLVTDKKIQIVLIKGKDCTFKRCFIRRLRIADAATISLVDCYVHVLALGEDSVRELLLSGGMIAMFECPPAYGPNPFIGRVSITNLYLPRHEREIGCQVSHQFRAMRAHLSAIHDTLSAGAFHSAELAMERPHDKPVNRVIGYIYEIMSDYGNSTLRPIVSLGVVYAVISVFVLLFDPLTTGPDLIGWHGDLEQSRLLRALAYPLFAIFNPLGVFSSKPILIATHALWSFGLTVLGLLGTFSLGLFVIGLRRRFKLD